MSMLWLYAKSTSFSLQKFSVQDAVSIVGQIYRSSQKLFVDCLLFEHLSYSLEKFYLSYA